MSEGAVLQLLPCKQLPPLSVAGGGPAETGGWCLEHQRQAGGLPGRRLGDGVSDRLHGRGGAGLVQAAGLRRLPQIWHCGHCGVSVCVCVCVCVCVDSVLNSDGWFAVFLRHPTRLRFSWRTSTVPIACIVVCCTF